MDTSAPYITEEKKIQAKIEIKLKQTRKQINQLQNQFQKPQDTQEIKKTEQMNKC